MLSQYMPLPRLRGSLWTKTNYTAREILVPLGSRGFVDTFRVVFLSRTESPLGGGSFVIIAYVDGSLSIRLPSLLIFCIAISEALIFRAQINFDSAPGLIAISSPS